MQLWDGIEGARGLRVLVMGATNRPWCIDEAVLRRFGLQYEVGLPGPPQRRAILEKYLLRHEAESVALRRAGLLAPGEGGVEAALLLDRPVAMLGAHAGEGCLSAVVRATEGYSGSDLTEVCAQAAQDVLAEKWAQEEAHHAAAGGGGGGGGGAGGAAAARPVRLRQLRGGDLLAALELVKPSTSRAGEYAAGQGGGADGGGDPLSLLLASMAGAMAAAGGGGAGGGGGGNGGSGNRGGGGGSSSGSRADGAPSDEALKALGLMVLNQLKAAGGAGGGR